MDWNEKLEDAVWRALEEGVSQDDVRDVVMEAIASWNEDQGVAAP
jgi:cAMP phosphodiesterase